MRLYFGPPKNPVRIITTLGGFRIKEAGGSETYVIRPHEAIRKIRRMFGVGNGSGTWFVGLMMAEISDQKDIK